MLLKDAYICLGSNEGDRDLNIAEAVQKMHLLGGVFRKSSLYESEPWGVSEQPWFLNQVLILKTTLPAEILLAGLQKIETELGRIRVQKWGQRIIDLDILFYGDEIIEEEDLIVPHPRISERRFNLLPLNELSPDLIHPLSGKDITMLLKECKDDLAVRIIS